MFTLGILLCSSVAVSSSVGLQQDDDAGKLVVTIGGSEAVAYQYGTEYAIPHYWPIRSPSGKLLTAQRPEPYPHHRSLWIADYVQGETSPAIDFYHCWKNYRESSQPESGFRHFIRHQRFGDLKVEEDRAVIEAHLCWMFNETEPLLDEHRILRVVALDGGEYFLDLTWELKAVHGSVRFLSDDVHYAWPYVRMHPRFSGDEGGTIVNDRGRMRQSGTNGTVARWVDYSNTVDGETEGLAVFIYPDGEERRWLTREYGTFGPRRSDRRSGTKFTLKAGDSLKGRVGILVHRGDVDLGNVAERYHQYIMGEL